jgi:hypothetical protein
MIAAEKGNFEILKILIENNADIYIHNKVFLFFCVLL